MIVAAKFTNAAGDHVLELRVSRVGGKRGQLWERQPGENDPVFLGSGYGFAAARSMARHKGLAEEVIA